MKTFFGVLLVFVLGCAAGILVSSIYFSHRAAVFLQRGAPAFVEVLERRMTQGLNLDANQKEQIHQIFMDNLQERKKLQAQIQPQVQALNWQTVRQIKTVLRPEQMEAFHGNLAEFRRRFGRNRPGIQALDPDTPTVMENSLTNPPPAQPSPAP